MLIRRSYVFRLMSKPAQAALLCQFAGCRRYIWNRMLALQNERFKNGEKWLSYCEMAKILTQWRNDPAMPWIAETPCDIQQQTLRDLEKAYKDFFKKIYDKPKFKKKGKTRESMRFPKVLGLDSGNGRVKLPKIGWMRYRKSQDVIGKPKNITVYQDGNHWFVSIQVEIEVAEPVHPQPNSAVGIDLGVAVFAALSNGEQIKPLNARKKCQDKLTRLQRQLAKKQKGSNRFKKQVKRINTLRRKERNRRNNFLHQHSHNISKNHATVVIEDLKIENMTASAKGTVEEPGTNVAQKSGLNRAILDQGWGEFCRQLEYKLRWRGGRLIKVNPAYTSQTCSTCGHCAKENRRTQAKFLCLSCGFTTNADSNAALNILRTGAKSALSACGGNPETDPMKRESCKAICKT